jgi:hypothetical protein
MKKEFHFTAQILMRYSSELNTSTLIYYRFQCFLFFFFVFLLSFPIFLHINLYYYFWMKSIFRVAVDLTRLCVVWTDIIIKMMPHYFDQLPVFEFIFFCEWIFFLLVCITYFYLLIELSTCDMFIPSNYIQ